MTETGLASSLGNGDDVVFLRELFNQAVVGGDAHALARAAQVLLKADGSRQNHRFLRNAIGRADSRTSGLRPYTIALLSSFSIEFLHDALIAMGIAHGLAITIQQSGFNTFRQDLLDGESSLYKAKPDLVVLAVEGEAWTVAPYGAFFDAAERDIEAVALTVRTELASLCKAFRSRCAAPLLIHNLAMPAWRKLGIGDAREAAGQTALVLRVNEAIASCAGEATDVHVVDYAGLVNRFGALSWYDDRMRLYAGAPIASAMQPHLAATYVQYVAALLGLAKKCAVLDLDNTLWGGIIGEDGIDAIALGATYPGSAFVEFQAYLRDLHRRGVILAVASKNNPSDAEEAFDKHPSMLLKRSDFAAMEINWGPKSESLVRLSKRLSIGLEHMVLIDDNPAECEEVRRSLPMVSVVQLPPRPEAYVRTLQEAALFDTLGMSVEDRNRGKLYAQRAEAEALRGAMNSVEDYYRDLAMKLTIAPVGKDSLTRTAQLTRKTNQFNVTTLRYSEAEVERRAQEPDWIVATVAVEDRFGDNGIVGVIMAQAEDDALMIDTLLLSCRVIGRTVETAMLAHLCDEAQRRGLRTLRGRVIPTPKNEPVKDLFARHGFDKVDVDGQGTTYWRLDLDAGRVAHPPWFA